MGQSFSNLLSGLEPAADRRDDGLRIVMLGLDGVGKTTALYNMKLGRSPVTIPTTGFNLETIECDTGVRFTVCDVGGGSKMPPLWPHYCQPNTTTAAIVYVVDSADRERLPESRALLDDLLSSAALVVREALPLLVLANKCDAPAALSAAEVADAFGSLASLMTGRRCWHVQATCAASGAGLSEGFRWLADELRN